MYNWKINAWKHPWKLQCPHCGQLFPKNDFHKFYLSGLDENSIFQHNLADRSLLYNTEHPDPADPLHKFGVDGGKGYSDGKRTWHFIATYLVYGQWKQVVLAGIENLADAYVITGDAVYARKAGILLDRVADLYPDFDFRTQGWMYERINYSWGYISYWQQAGEELQAIALAYDKVRGNWPHNRQLVHFLSQKAMQHKLENPKSSHTDIRRNIEDRILRDSLNHPSKIRNNYPLQEIVVTYVKTILDWPEKRDEIIAEIQQWMEEAVRVDGVTGEKGGYSSLGLNHILSFLGHYDRAEPGFLRKMVYLLPDLRKTYRFHIDTRVLEAYNILPGDGGTFGRKQGYRIQFSKRSGLDTSAYSFFWKLYEITGDPTYAQTLYRENSCKLDGLPYDIFCESPVDLQFRVQEAIDRVGAEIQPASIDKKQWRLAILRSGEGDKARALALDYDSGGRHGHKDGMVLSLYAKGLDLMPDLGYPPVQFGGWDTQQVKWYYQTASHPTVVVDGKDNNGVGKTTLWADGERFRAIRASGADLTKGKQFERTATLIDISESDCYVLDIFRVVGGNDHAKFMHSYFGTIGTEGLSLKAGRDYGYGTLMRNFQTDTAAEPGWSVDWKIEDSYGYLPHQADVHLRYIDLTSGAEASIAEGWVAASRSAYSSKAQDWIPRIMVRRSSEQAPLASTFVAVIEPYDGQSNIRHVRRCSLRGRDGLNWPDTHVAVEVQLVDGRKDIIIAADVENPMGLTPDWQETAVMVPDGTDVRFRGELCWVRWDSDGSVSRIAICRGQSISTETVSIGLKVITEFIEVHFDDNHAKIVAGSQENVGYIKIGNRSVWNR
ncbi:MAG: heparinase II/III family protein [Phycisphaerae bacterium]|nr:heparinase II/III family protein [Phycisphaerae bacterium]